MASVVEIAFAGDELLEVFDQGVGDFELGGALGGVGDGEAVLVVPGGDEAFGEGGGEDGEGGARVIWETAHGHGFREHNGSWGRFHGR